ncbi:MAG: EamA family transporter [Gemmatimonadetes bacterium]|nr:EamA family transporter [Gemmatimonadota bacterium]MCC6773986.1 EamA family transporter [Gemmatimonadaceae bacterium]
MAVSASGVVAASDATSRDEESRWVTDVLLLLMAIIWGVNFSVLKYGTQFVAPLAFNGTRIPIAAATQLGIASAMRLERVPRSLALRLILLGMLGNGVYQVLFILGVVRTRVATAALIIAATPAFIAILGRIFGTELLTRRQWMGIALQVVGCSTVVMGSARGDSGTDSFAGGALLLGAAFSWAVYSVLLRRLGPRVHVVQIGGYTMLGGAMITCAVALPAMLATDWLALPSGFYAAVFYSAIGAMVFAYLFWYRGLRVLGATRTAVYSNLQPLFAALVAYFAFHEVPTIPQGIGAAFVVSGLLLTRR